MTITEATTLAALPLTPAQLEVVLDEVFLVPPAALFPEEPRPATVGELAVRTRLAPAEVMTRLQRIVRMSEDIEISVEELKAALDAGAQGGADAPMLVDVRQDWEFEIAHIAGSVLLGQENFAELLPRMRAAKSVVAICHHGMRSYSAAMFLRQNGVPQALSLAGGVHEWALVIDRDMARY